MSLASTSTLKTNLETQLGPKSAAYFDTLNQFITGKTSRAEFDETIRVFLDAPNLILLHNSLIISLFDATKYLKRPPTPPPEQPKPPPRKRRRTLPYQGPDFPDEGLRSARLKRWTLSVGKRERDRLRNLQTVPPPHDPSRPRRDMDEIARERGIELLSERGDPPGSRLPLHLAAITHGPTIQHIQDRVNLISAQHNLGTPSKTVSSLLMLAFEAKLKQLITHALTLTSTSHAISSIQPSVPQGHSTILPTSAFSTLFTVAPSDLPNKSAAAMRLALGDNTNDEDEDADILLLKDREVRDQRWQMVALLGERSTLKEALRTIH